LLRIPIQLRLRRQPARQVVILPQKMSIPLPRISRPANRLHNMFPVKHTHQPINPRRIRQQLRLVPLHQATRDHHPLALSIFLQLDRLPDFRQRFGFRRFQKSAGIDNDGIRIRRIRRDGQPIISEQPQHPFAVHQVLGTTEADKSDGSNLVSASTQIKLQIGKKQSPNCPEYLFSAPLYSTGVNTH